MDATRNHNHYRGRTNSSTRSHSEESHVHRHGVSSKNQYSERRKQKKEKSPDVSHRQRRSCRSRDRSSLALPLFHSVVRETSSNDRSPVFSTIEDRRRNCQSSHEQYKDTSESPKACHMKKDGVLSETNEFAQHDFSCRDSSTISKRRRGRRYRHPKHLRPLFPAKKDNNHARSRKRRSSDRRAEDTEVGYRAKRKRHRRGRRRSSSESSSHSISSRVSPSGLFTGVVSEEEDAEIRKVLPQGVTLESEMVPSLKERKTSGSFSSWDDSVGHFQGSKGTIVADRYKIVREVGLGTFGRVVECLDLNKEFSRNTRSRSQGYHVAIKIVRNIKRYYDSAVIEARILAEVNRCGGRGCSHYVILHDSFSFDGHYCMVFESLGPSLYDFLRRHHYQPFPMVCVQDFVVQLLEALEFIHRMRLIHTDLKIENILLMNDREVCYRNQRVPESTKIKIIDFGGACYDNEKKSTIISTRQYRAPEVILGTGWSMPSDMWSAGCIFAEIYQGELLFATHDNPEHLALMERIVGYFPQEMIAAAKNGPMKDIATESFNSRGYHRMERILDHEKCSFVRRKSRLEHFVRNPSNTWFLRLLQRILCIDPMQRATAHECLAFLSRHGKNVVLYN